MYIKRKIEDVIISAAKQFPVITITGPRQSGKTTLVRNVFKDKPYINLELPDVSERIQQDPISFFNKYKDGVIIDEIQRMPELMRYIQGIVDEHKQSGMFILKGLDARYYFYRDNHGNEVDLIIPQGYEISGVEIKSSQTYNKDFLKGLTYFKKVYPERCKNNLLIYDGEDIGKIKDTEIINFRSIGIVGT